MPKRSTSTRASPSSAFSGGACLRAEPSHRGRSAVRAARGGLSRGGPAAQGCRRSSASSWIRWCAPTRSTKARRSPARHASRRPAAGVPADGKNAVRTHNGTYGKPGEVIGRQRYPNGRHNFASPLPREHVDTGEGHCGACEQMRCVQHGDQVVARAQSWNPRVVAEGLEKLASGPDTSSSVGSSGNGRPLAGPGPARRSPTRSGNDASSYDCGRARSGGPGGRESQGSSPRTWCVKRSPRDPVVAG